MSDNLINKTLKALKTDGIQGVTKRAKHYIKVKKAAKPKNDTVKDILFINGCSYDLLPHPPRYRIKHQMEQLELNRYTCDEVFYKHINVDMTRMYRAFIIFRTPITDELKQFITMAKSLNKKVFFDVDDLVIDTKYTHSIKFLETMSQNQRKQYNQDILNMRETLSMCDFAITTTQRLADELSNYVSRVFINRNTASIEMIALSNQAILTKKNSDKIRIGYFSGSISHNDDFNMIIDVLTDILETYSNIELHIVGDLDVNNKLNKYQSRIITHPFVDYKELPKLISQVDINLAPLQNSIFNEAKSEIKWIEAALVKTCTIASDIGAFKQMIKHNETGILCSNLEEWKNELIRLIQSKSLRNTLAENAYSYCIKNCTTIYSGQNLVNIIKENISLNIAFAVSKLELSGGIMIALKHASILQSIGYDVSILSLYDNDKWFSYSGYQFPILPIENEKLDFHLDKAVATMWPTVNMIEEIKCIKKRMYLVQGFETDFYDFGDPLKFRANQSYSPKTHFEFLTISNWCQLWLKEKFNHDSKLIPNGIDIKLFSPHKRKLNSKIKILIEGDCAVKNKNIDESFKIIEKLDPNKYEVWYMSYNAKPKEWYRVDKFLHKIPHSDVHKIYQECDILLKTSILESFSLPPLEMMATGGYVIAVPNDGNIEYLEHKKNCLLFPKGNIDEAIEMIEEIQSNNDLQETLYINGIQTAKSRDWDSIKEIVYKSYHN